MVIEISVAKPFGKIIFQSDHCLKTLVIEENVINMKFFISSNAFDKSVMLIYRRL